MKKIVVFASVGCQNLGDELILKNECRLLKQEFGKTEFRIASYDPHNPLFEIKNARYFEYFPFGIKKVKNIFRNIKNFSVFLKNIIWSDCVVIGGGGIIYDSELQSVSNPLRQWLFRVRVAKFFRKKIYFYALGIDIKNQENFKILEKIFSGAFKITVRDIKSWEQLKKVGVESEIVDDPVMSDFNSDTFLSEDEGMYQKNEASFSSGREGIQDRDIMKGEVIKNLSSKKFSLRDFEGIDFAGKEVGLALRKGYIGASGNERIEKLLVEELCRYIEQQGGSIVFLPHSLHQSDALANDLLFMQQFMGGERRILEDLKDVYEWYKQGGENKMIISMRLHSIILAAIYSIPQLVLSYSQKTDEVIKKLSK